MVDAGMPAPVRVWDVPLRIWHWLLVGAVATSLYTGLSGDLALLDWHFRAGYAVLGLLVFRLGWFCWGGLHARWSGLRPRVSALRAWLGGRPAAGVRTAPGAWLVTGLLASVTGQALAGLFTSDFIFTDGPLARYASATAVEALSWLHHRLYWLVGGLIAVHLTAHVIYGVRGDATPLAMFNGVKRVDAVATPDYWLRALATAAATLALAWWAARLL